MISKIESILTKKLRFDVRYFVNGGFWLMSGHLFTIVSILATSYFFANFLDPQTYGVYKYLVTAGIILTAFSLTGLQTGVTQAAAKHIVGYLAYASRLSVKYGLIVSALACIGAGYYAFNDNNQLAIGLILIGLFQPLINTTTLIFAQLVGEQRFYENTTAHVLRVLITTCSTVAAIVLSGNIFVLISAYLIGNLAANQLVRILYTRHEATIDLTRPEATNITNYSKHISVQNIISTLSNQADKILIFQNLGAIELATYAFATALPDQYKGFTKTIETMVLPRFSKHSAKSVRARMWHKTVIYFICLLVLALTYILVAPYIFAVLYPAYAESVYLSQVYALAILFGIGSLPIAGMKAQLAKKRLYTFNIVTSIFQITLLLILLPLYGLIGAVVSRVLYRAFVAISAYMIYFYQAKE